MMGKVNRPSAKLKVKERIAGIATEEAKTEDLNRGSLFRLGKLPPGASLLAHGISGGNGAKDASSKDQDWIVILKTKKRTCIQHGWISIISWQTLTTHACDKRETDWSVFLRDGDNRYCQEIATRDRTPAVAPNRQVTVPDIPQSDFTLFQM
ncbi:hypothetical protein BJX70DRAFT_363253, partial [Aspergillus crustosus]